MAARQRRGKDVRSSKAASPAATSDSRVKLDERDENDMASFIKGQPVWILLAVASGACAAINGVFAKLTTTSLTGNLAVHMSTLLGLAPDNNAVNVALRGTFFGLNLIFNGIMWTLFTKALTQGDSTTRVSIINVSANFFITAMLGWAIFGEQLPMGWWVGAGLLAAGNVVIGRREEVEKIGSRDDQVDQSVGLMSEQVHGDLIELDEPLNGRTPSNLDEESLVKKGEEIDAPI